MKVLHIVASYKPAVVYGGPVVSVSALCEKLNTAGVTADVYTTNANGPRDLDIETGKKQLVEGVTVTYFRRLTGDHTHFSPSLQARLWQSVKNYDLVHIHAWWNTVSVLSCLVALLRGKKVLLSPRGTLSDYSFSNRNGFYKKMIHFLVGKRLLSRCFFHVTSENERRHILRFAARERVAMIPNLVRFPAIRPGGESPSATFRILFFSRIEQKKGLDILLHALKDLDLPFSLTVAGSGTKDYADEMKQLADRLGLTGIDWLGQVSPDRKYDCLAAHDLVVLPSHNENFGNVVLESLSVGTPVMVSKEVGLSDYIAERGFGWIGDLRPAVLAQQIRAAWQNPEQRMMIRHTAPQRIRDDFDEAEVLNEYVELYSSINNERL